MILIHIGIGWLFCLVISYLLFRRVHRREVHQWHTSDRIFYIMLSVLGPVSLLSSLIFIWKFRVRDTSEKIAKW